MIFGGAAEQAVNIKLDTVQLYKIVHMSGLPYTVVTVLEAETQKQSVQVFRFSSISRCTPFKPQMNGTLKGCAGMKQLLTLTHTASISQAAAVSLINLFRKSETASTGSHVYYGT